jgi:DNA/RNA endonuclease G (NUC1)
MPTHKPVRRASHSKSSRRTTRCRPRPRRGLLKGVLARLDGIGRLAARHHVALLLASVVSGGGAGAAALLDDLPAFPTLSAIAAENTSVARVVGDLVLEIVATAAIPADEGTTVAQAWAKGAKGGGTGCLMGPLEPAPGYRHKGYGVLPHEQLRVFQGFAASFDGPDDDDGDGQGDLTGTPSWVAYEIRRGAGAKTERPKAWCDGTDPLRAPVAGAPADASYAYPQSERRRLPGQLGIAPERGHLAAKYHMERVSAAAAWNSHVTLNAVPQDASFNAGSWFDLECATGAWANRYGAAWVVAGPVHDRGRRARFIGEPRWMETAVRVPDALFKVVAVPVGDQLHAMAFLMANEPESGKDKRKWTRALVPVDRIEALTGLDLFAHLPAEAQVALEAKAAPRPLPVGKVDYDPGCQAAALDLG